MPPDILFSARYRIIVKESANRPLAQMQNETSDRTSAQRNSASPAAEFIDNRPGVSVHKAIQTMADRHAERLSVVQNPATRSTTGRPAQAWARPDEAVLQPMSRASVVQLVGNGYYDALLDDDEEDVDTEEDAAGEYSDDDDVRSGSGSDDDEEESVAYVDVIKEGIAHSPPAFVINAILPYSDVDRIPVVVEAMLHGLNRRLYGDRVGIVLGINAKNTQVRELQVAMRQAQRHANGWRLPIGLVPITWSEKSFPYGKIRNAVMQSAETRQITDAFIGRNYHPYVSIQDFDAGKRLVPPSRGEREGIHIFRAVERLMGNTMRPLMIGGGYRPNPDLVAQTLARIASAFPGEENAERRRTLSEEVNAPGFAEGYAAHVRADMNSRQILAGTHPLLPYTPEPNLFLDGMALRFSADLGAPAPAFGEGAAEFAHLAKTLSAVEQAELSHYYLPRYHQARADEPVRKSTPTSERVFDLGDLDGDDDGAAAIPASPDRSDDESLMRARPGQEHFLDIDELDDDDAAVAPRLPDKSDVLSRLSGDLQNNRNPYRGQNYVVDYQNLAIQTDLSRLAFSLLSTGKDPQSHVGLATPADRFFDDKSAKQGASMRGFSDRLTSGDAPSIAPSGMERLPAASSSSEAEDEDIRRTSLFFGMAPKLSDPGSKEARAKEMPFRAKNAMSLAISRPFPEDGPFAGMSTGIQPSQKTLAFGLTSMQSSIEISKLALLLQAFMQAALGRGTPMDGNCLYHAVYQASNGNVAANLAEAAKLRQTTVNWVLNGANLPLVARFAYNNGTSIDDLVDIISSDRGWAGNAGDLAPRILASALNITLVLHQGGGITRLTPLSGGGAREVHVDLAGAHYSVHLSGAGGSPSISSPKPDRGDSKDGEA